MTETRRIGKYEIAEQIGVGGFGIVYKAWDPYIRRWVALKVCNAHEKEATARFFREAQLAGALQHPNITLIFDFGVEDDTPYFVQEFLTGHDLDDLVEGQHPTLPGVLAIVIQVCQGLEFAHARGIVHRDIKPANIRVLEDGTVKIMDFGIAKSLQSGESQLTQTGVALGTAGYLAPEQLAGQPLSARTDLFSLGVMTYELVTGARPFTGPNLSNVIYQILNQEPIPVRQRCPSCPERLERAIHRALAKKPEQRFDGVREFGQELKEILASLAPTSERKAGTTTALVRQEFSGLQPADKERQTSPTELGARPLELLQTSTTPDPPKRSRRWPILAGAAVVIVAAALAWPILRDTTSPPAASLVPTPLPTAISQPTAVPEPVATPTAVAATPVEVDLFVDPPAEVSVDGTPLGRVQSTRVTLSPGRHEIRQRIPGYRETTHTIEVTRAGEQFNLRLPPFGLLTVMNDMGVAVRGARVFVDGKEVGNLPLIEMKVEAGRREVKVSWPDGSQWSDTVDITAMERAHRTARPGST